LNGILGLPGVPFRPCQKDKNIFLTPLALYGRKELQRAMMLKAKHKGA
jgi:hypothetical protein